MLRVVLRVHPGMMSPRLQPQGKLQGVFVNLPHVIRCYSPSLTLVQKEQQQEQ